MKLQLKKSKEAEFRRYIDCLQEAGVVEERHFDPFRLRQVSYRRMLARSVMPQVVTIAMEWADQDRSVYRLVEIGNQALFKAMRDYRVESDGDFFTYLVVSVEASIIS